jgi:RimJ/RimL family protein N-acetyltransferase
LRNVELCDVDAYVRMRCDPVMMAELGGPLPRDGVEDKVARDVKEAAEDAVWIKMIVADEQAPEVASGQVVLWSHEQQGGERISETGWMVLPEYQGKGVATWAVRTLLGMARDDGRWGPVHAFPGVTNGPSNGICRSLGFTLLGEQDIPYAGDRVLRVNHWVVDPGAGLSGEG